MLLARCPKCKSQYTIFNVNIHGEATKIKICFKCGWTEDYNFKHARYFEKDYHNIAAPYAAMTMKHRYLGGAHIDDVLDVFGEHISSIHNAMIMISYSAYNVKSRISYKELLEPNPYTKECYDMHVHHESDMVFPFIYSYTAPHTIFTDNYGFGINMYFMSMMNDTERPNIIIIPSSAYPILTHNYCDSDFYSAIYTAPRLLKILDKSHIKPVVACSLTKPIEPAYLFLRLFEEQVYEQWNNFGDTEQLWLDSEELINNRSAFHGYFKKSDRSFTYFVKRNELQKMF